MTVVKTGIQDEALDTNGNGLYDVLNVTFQVDTRKSGSYVWSGSLQTQGGAILGLASGNGNLDTGETPIQLGYAGTGIGESGIDGPYYLKDVAIYGPSEAAAVVDEVGATSAYRFTEFEGSEVSFDRLIQKIKELVLTGIGGIPRAEGIRTSLLRKAQNAQRKAEQNKSTAAKNILGAFINEVRAQSDKHLAAADAAELIGLAEGLIASL